MYHGWKGKSYGVHLWKLRDNVGWEGKSFFFVFEFPGPVDLSLFLSLLISFHPIHKLFFFSSIIKSFFSANAKIFSLMRFIKFHSSSRGLTISIPTCDNSPSSWYLFINFLFLSFQHATFLSLPHAVRENPFRRWIYDITNCIKLNLCECEKNSNEKGSKHLHFMKEIYEIEVKDIST